MRIDIGACGLRFNIRLYGLACVVSLFVSNFPALTTVILFAAQGTFRNPAIWVAVKKLKRNYHDIAI